jgi:hypothetical protein
MNQFRRNGGWLVFVGAAMMVSPLAQAAAADVEYREFSLRVDHKPAGNYQIKITTPDDTTTVVSCLANVEVKKIAGLVRYTYTYRGTETWQGQRLVRLESATDDNGTKYTVNVAAEGQWLRVKVNGQERLNRPDVWTTSYWRLPEAKFRNGGVPLLDADTARAIDGQMRYVGTDALTVGGQTQNCAHYRVTGKGIEVDVWYDAQERMVRQESVEEGHRTVFALTSLRRAER